MKVRDAAGDALFQGNLEWSADGGEPVAHPGGSPESVDGRSTDSPESSGPCGCIPRSPSAERYTVMVHVDPAMQGAPGRVNLDDRLPILPETARRPACDEPMVEGRRWTIWYCSARPITGASMRGASRFGWTVRRSPASSTGMASGSPISRPRRSSRRRIGWAPWSGPIDSAGSIRVPTPDSRGGSSGTKSSGTFARPSTRRESMRSVGRGGRRAAGAGGASPVMSRRPGRSGVGSGGRML